MSGCTFRALLVFLIACFIAPVYAEDSISDPLEPMNRGIFWFNDTLDENILEPVAEGYDWALPDEVQNCVKNFFRNLRFPVQLVSNVMQLRLEAAAEDTGRFLVNTTVGVGGLFDVVGGKYERQDIGTALGSYGIGEGPYLVLPFLGPSNVRDTAGMAVGFFLDPLYWLYTSDAFDDDTDLAIAVGLTSLEAINTRARYLDIFRDMKENSVDYYLAQQSFYLQYRQGLIEGEAADDDWYEDEEDFE